MQRLRQFFFKRSIRFSVFITMAACFIVMFILLYIGFSSGMNTMLENYENDSMRSQVKLSRNMLLMSVDNLPTLTREWAALVYTYDYVTGENDSLYVIHLTQDAPYDTNEINLLAVLDHNRNILFEKNYRYKEHRTVPVSTDLSGLFVSLGESCCEKYHLLSQTNPTSNELMGTSGFISKDGEVYFLSACPVADIRGERPCVGTIVFGRLIDDEELDAMTGNAGVAFSVMPVSQLQLSDTEAQALQRDGSLMRFEDDTAIKYETFNDVWGQPTLLIAVTSPRDIYASGQALINMVLLLSALGCSIVLVIILNSLGRLFLHPLARLSAEVDVIDIKKADSRVSVSNNNREMRSLTTSINNMLARIQQNHLEIKEKNDSLYQQANFDMLTGLHNRISAAQILEDMLAAARGTTEEVTVFCCCFDRFKDVNDSLGPYVGDQVMKQFGQRLSRMLPPGVLLARMSGATFMVCTAELNDNFTRQKFANGLLHLFDEPFKVKERTIYLSASMGSSVFPQDGNDAETLVKNAEMAMYQVKDLGQGMYAMYQKSFETALNRKLDIENKLRQVISEGFPGFEAYFQPKVSVETGQIHKCEALIRWHTPEGMVSPGEFIPGAEESGLVVPLTWWMIDECCRIASLFARQGLAISIAINIPAQVFTHADFMYHLQNAVKKHGVNPALLDMEITEGTLLADMHMVNEVMENIHQFGPEISVDDFGTGYSSLSYLSRMAVDRIKIDQSFVAGLGADKESGAIVTAIVALAKSLHLQITAEGVEEVEQYRFLQNLGCDEVQGYLVARPMPAPDFIEFMQNWKGTPF